MPPGRQHAQRPGAGRGGLLRVPGRRYRSPERRTVGQSTQTRGEATPGGALAKAVERSRRPGCPEAPRGTLPPGSRRYLCGAATPRSPSRRRGRLPPRPAVPIGAVLMDWEVNLTDSWNWEKGGLVLETPQGRTFFFFNWGLCCPFNKVFQSSVFAFLTSENSRHSPSPSSDILVQAVIVASWGRRGELPAAVRGWGPGGGPGVWTALGNGRRAA